MIGSIVTGSIVTGSIYRTNYRTSVPLSAASAADNRILTFFDIVKVMQVV